MIDAVKAAEDRGDTVSLQRYCAPLGKWVWRRKQCNFNLLPAPTRDRLRRLKCFGNGDKQSWSEDEWNRMFGLCQQFELNHGYIAHVDVSGHNPIGRWLTIEHLRPGPSPFTATHKAKLATLATVKKWSTFRRKRNRPSRGLLEGIFEEFIQSASYGRSLIGSAQGPVPPMEPGVEAEEGKPTCSLCIVNVPNVVMVPCGHVCACVPCMVELHKKNQMKCLLCRAEVRQAVKAFV